MHILSFTVRVVVEENDVNADKVTDEITEILREQLPDGDAVANCLVDTILSCNDPITYSNGVK